MEDGLVHNNLVLTAKPLSVLILIVVEDGLVPDDVAFTLMATDPS